MHDPSSAVKSTGACETGYLQGGTQVIYQGQMLSCRREADGIVEMRFDAQSDAVNKFDQQTLSEFKAAVAAISALQGVRGLVVTTGKRDFFVGADITEFVGYFRQSEEFLVGWLKDANATFSALEDLPYPTVSCIDGFALGGGFELALSTTYRVASAAAQVGLPETQLGIFPGFGGTVRLPRLIGADNAIEWIAGGKKYKADEALKVGAVDAVVRDAADLLAAARALIEEAHSGRRDWRARQKQKTSALRLNKIEAGMVFVGAKGFVGGQAGPHYPAPVAAIEVIEKGAGLSRDQALPIESQGFAKMAKTPTARHLVGLFLGEQFLKKKAKTLTKAQTRKVEKAGVLGAGIMGGGVAYQSASKNIPIVMKDIRDEALQLGMDEAGKLFSKLVEKKRLKVDEMAVGLSRIRPTLSYDELRGCDLVVEAVVENATVKKNVLAETESLLAADAILTSNTSTISITGLAQELKRPENFCGMHFFNPVHKMPLVEVIRGAKTGDAAVAATVSYALAMGKTPVVVNDCPGFLVNRILFAYFGGFVDLLRAGVDFVRIDKVMEKFGWPMGPAYLLDVVGIDTAHHASEVMASGFPERMKFAAGNAIARLYAEKRFGQKNGVGFYKYGVDKKGRPVKEQDPAVAEILAAGVTEKREVTDEEIVQQMMLPMVLESSRCLEDKIVDSPIETDMALIYGLGFPAFRGGIFAYADDIGASMLGQWSDKLSVHGPLYQFNKQMKNMRESNTTFYPQK